MKSIFFSENTPKIPQKIFAHHGSNFKKHRISQNCDFDGFKKEAQLSPRDPLDAVALSVEVLSTSNGGGYHKQIAWSYVSLRNDFCNRQFLFGYRHSYLWYTYGIVTIGSAVAQARANSVSHYTRNAERLNWTELVVNMLIITSCQFSSIKWDSSPCENESQVSHRCYKLNWDDRMLLMILKLSPSAQRNFL